MPYREDENLIFLGEMQDEDLNDLVDTLIRDKDGKSRYTEELTKRELYKKYPNQHSKYWRDISAEIQCFGANSFATLFRQGQGVLYREILEDVCDTCKVEHEKSQSIGSVEDALLVKLVGEATKGMSNEELENFSKIAGLNAAKDLTPEGIAVAAQIAIMAGGTQAYRLALLIANYITRILLGRGLTIAGSASLSRTLGVMTGPVGWIATGAWTAIDIASPAFRVTLPAVIQIALLRKKYKAKIAGLWADIEKSMQ